MPAHTSITALRSALGSEYPVLRSAAERVIRRALADTTSLAAAARALGVERRSLDRIRAEFPSVFAQPDPRVGAE